MASEGNGYWYADLTHAAIGDEYRYLIRTGRTELSRIDPYARQVTNSIGNAVIVDPAYDWQGDDFQMPPWNELVVYEVHVGTSHRPEDDEPGTFADAIAKSTSQAARHQRDSDHVGDGVRGRHLLGLQSGPRRWPCAST